MLKALRIIFNHLKSAINRNHDCIKVIQIPEIPRLSADSPDEQLVSLLPLGLHTAV